MNLPRRDLLRLGSLGLLAAGLPNLSGCAKGGAPAASDANAVKPARSGTRVLRFAHLTDTHVQPEKRAGEGLAACLAHVQSHPIKPELIITGGDHVMDSFDSDDARTRVQWELFLKTWRAGTSLPTEFTIGNHDCWGWNKTKSKTSGTEANWGKKRFLEMTGAARTYRSFDRSGWHFIILDSISPEGTGYVGLLDNEQFEWLKADLAATPATTPILLVSHIPIVTASAMFNGKDEVMNNRPIPGGLMHTDAKRLMALFRKHPNVRLCISGHIHLNDRIDFHNVSYVCAGAVSGGWWKGKNDDCSEGYTLVDLYDNGMFEYNYIHYGWTAEA
ncbi:MAG: metallophosphoesterase family protein [Phycisphaerales bacterium]